MSPPIAGFITLAAAIVDWFARETIKAWFFERVVHSMNPTADVLLEYGPPLALAGLGIYLLLRGNTPPKQRTRRHMFSLFLMVAGAVLLIVGAFIFRAET